MPRTTDVLLMWTSGEPVVFETELWQMLGGRRAGSVTELGTVLVVGCPPLFLLLELILAVRCSDGRVDYGHHVST